MYGIVYKTHEVQKVCKQLGDKILTSISSSTEYSVAENLYKILTELLSAADGRCIVVNESLSREINMYLSTCDFSLSIEDEDHIITCLQQQEYGNYLTRWVDKTEWDTYKLKTGNLTIQQMNFLRLIDAPEDFKPIGPDNTPTGNHIINVADDIRNKYVKGEYDYKIGYLKSLFVKAGREVC